MSDTVPEEQGGISYDHVLANLQKALAKPRRQATMEANWLLMAEAFGARADIAARTAELNAWKDSIEHRLSDLDDEPSTGYALESRRNGLEASRAALVPDRERAQQRYNAHREAIAQMLNAIRDSKKVYLGPAALSRIEVLNRDGYLAQALGMDPKEFSDYYAPRPAGDRAPASRRDEQPAPDPSGLPAGSGTGVDFSRQAVGAQAQLGAARTATAVRHAPVPAVEPERSVDTDWEPGF